MERQVHIAELPDENRFARVVAAFFVAAMVAGGTAWCVYGSGLWAPAVHHVDQ